MEDDRIHNRIHKRMAALRRSGKAAEAIRLGLHFEAEGHVDGLISLEQAKFLCELASCYLKQRDYQAAEQRYHTAITRFPNNAVAHTGYAQTALVRGDFTAAQERINAALKLERNARNYALLAALSLHTGNITERTNSMKRTLDGLMGECEPNLKTLKIIHSLIGSLREDNRQQYRLRVQQLDNALDILVNTGRFTAEALAPFRQQPLPITKEVLFDEMCNFSSSTAVFSGRFTHAINTHTATTAFGAGHGLDGTPYSKTDHSYTGGRSY